MKSLSVSIPSPCHENWHKMSPVNKGRFCSSCEKVVFDFTRMSDAELFAYLSQTKEATCGRFNYSQLSRGVKQSSPKTFGAMKWIASFLLWLSANNISDAHEKLSQPNISTEKIYQSKIDFVIKNDDEKEWGKTITGYVKDKKDSTACVSATVRIKGTGISCIANSTGYFELKIPENYHQKRLIIEVAYIGYANKEISLSTKKSVQQKQIIFIEENVSGLLGEVVIVGYTSK